jgi:hypothetical protein
MDNGQLNGKKIDISPKAMFCYNEEGMDSMGFFGQQRWDEG